MDAKNQPSSDIPDLPPGTYEYIETKKKKNWKKIVEITAILIIAAVPLVLSLFKIDYSLQRVYEVVNPAYIGLSPSYQNWGSVITKTKKLIQSTTETISKGNFPGTGNTNTEQITHTPTPSPSPAANPTANPTAYPTQVESQSIPTPVEEQIIYPIPTDTQITIDPSPTSSPTPSPTLQPTQDNDQTGTDEAFIACIGKKKGARCSYFSNYGNEIEGRCKISSEGYLTCVPNWY